MKKLRTTFLHIVLLTLTTMLLASCAQYSTKTNKDPGFSTKLTNVYIWSSIGTVEPFTKKLLFSADTFEHQFNTALAKEFTKSGVKNELRDFSPSTDSLADLARFEGTFNPNYRLLVISPRYDTITSRGVTNVDNLYLDISVIRIKDNKQVWQSSIVIQTNTAPGTAWREAGANKLAEQIVDALKKDGLI